ncbi:MAG: tetratricopeptide repeat protein [Bacteroidota bacterium]|nr:tetratricopeptide repeat protein [Bacteroidota bacterium]
MTKKILLFATLFFIFLNGFGGSFEDSLQAGNTFYSQEKFEDAIRAYEYVIEQGYEAPELYYNLGNAYFKSHKITYSILNYEKAVLLDPRNEDIEYNLNLAKSFVVDKIELVPGFVLSEWHHAFVNLFSSDVWAIISISTFFLLLLFLSMYLYLRNYGIKKLFFWFSVLLLYVTISSFVFSYHHRRLLLNPGTALVLSPSVTVESSPDQSGTDLFLIHEGTKLTVKESVGDWTKIRLSDGKEGWVPTESIILI